MDYRRHIDETLHAIADSPMYQYIATLAQYARIQANIKNEPFPSQEDVLKGCDALGHSQHLQEILELPIANVTLTGYECGCVLGFVGFHEIAGAICDTHIAKLTNVKSPLDFSLQVLRDARHEIRKRWLDMYGRHHKEKHEWIKDVIENDRGWDELRDWVFKLNEQDKHDDIAKRLLDE